MSGQNDSILSQNPHFPNMKHKPYKLTFRIAVCFAAVSAVGALQLCRSVPAVAQETTPETADSTAADTAPASSVTELDALEVLKGVRDRLEGLEYLECTLQETVHLSDLRFYATGRYAQASRNRVRLELKIFPIRGVKRKDEEILKLDGTMEDTEKQKPTGELTQVSDGNILWSLWKNGDSRRLTRRNIQEILDAADEAQGFSRDRIFEDLGVGGLQTLLARLEAGMEFGKVREQTVGDTRLLVVSGRWTRESLETYFQLKDPSAPRPSWLPDYVRVYIDADAHLPRRIQYLKKHPNPEVKQVRPLLVLDFRDMTVNGTMEGDPFRLDAPSGLAELDDTQKIIETIRKVAAGTAEPGNGTPAPTDQPESDAAPVKSEG